MYLSFITTLSLFCIFQVAENVELNHLLGDVQQNLTIINGHEATEHEVPSIAAIILQTPDGKEHFCAGVLISPKYILTAAHCIKGSVEARIILGAHRPKKEESTQIIIPVISRIIPHRNYVKCRHANDIGLIKLPVKVPQTEYINYARLPTRADAARSYVNQTARAYGWGYTSEKSGISKVLNYVDLPVLDNDACVNRFPFITDKNICTSGREDGTLFIGDSGGPLILDGVVIGVVSYGSEKCSSQSPNIFMKLSRYLDWIEKYSDLNIL